MTTIATDGKTIAADGLVVCGNTISKRNSIKLYRVNTEIVGIAGKIDDALTYLRWYREGGEPPTDSSIDVLHLRKDGVYTANAPNWNLFKVDTPYTIGSGEGIAMGAMLAGCTPEEAVRWAVKYDIYTGGRIHVMEL